MFSYENTIFILFIDSSIVYFITDNIVLLDVLFNEGANLLFHVALAIFKLNEEELLTVYHVGNVIQIIQRCTHQLFDPDEFLTALRCLPNLSSCENWCSMGSPRLGKYTEDPSFSKFLKRHKDTEAMQNGEVDEQT